MYNKSQGVSAVLQGVRTDESLQNGWYILYVMSV